MEFLEISSLSTMYRYDIKIKQKIKQKKWSKETERHPQTIEKGQIQGGVT